MTDLTKDCPLASALADRLRQSKGALTNQWLERITARVSIDPNRVFPTESLLDHVPLLIDGIADYLEDPAAEVSTDMPVVGKAMELGALRYTQGFDVYEILKEYEILGGIVFNHLANAADELQEPCEKSELLVCGHRLFRAVAIIQETTTTHFLLLAEEAMAEREDKLRNFNRTVSHEVKNRIGAALGASELLLEIEDMPLEQRIELAGIISRTMRSMQATVENLIGLSGTERDARRHRHVRLPEAIKEARRQVREAAQAAGIEVRILSGMPDAEVNASAVELCLTNYLSNSIKYSDRNKSDRFAEISALVEKGPDGRKEIVVRVRDNGLGVTGEFREQLFQRFFRAREGVVTGVEGTGLGLSIVRETVESLGGRAWAEFPQNQQEGAVFAFSLPYRRRSDQEQTEA